MGKIVARVHVSNRRQMPVCFSPSVLGSIPRLANRAADKYLPHSWLLSSLRHGKRVWKDRYLHAVYVQRRGAQRRFLVVRLPEIKFVRRSLEQFDYVDGTLSVIRHERAACRVIAAAFQLYRRSRDERIHTRAIPQAFCDSSLRVLVLNNQRSVLAGIFSLPQYPHLAYRGRRNKVIGQLCRRKPCVCAWGGRSSHG